MWLDLLNIDSQCDGVDETDICACKCGIGCRICDSKEPCTEL